MSGFLPPGQPERNAQSKIQDCHLAGGHNYAYAEREFGACFDALPPNAFTIGDRKSMLKAQRAGVVVTTARVETDGSTGGFIQRTDSRISCNAVPRYVCQECVLAYCDRGTADHVISEISGYSHFKVKN